jgi:hypothetical protein
MTSTWCAEHTASRAPSGENVIPWFGPNVIRTMTSARSAPVMPDIMDHVARLNVAGGAYPDTRATAQLTVAGDRTTIMTVTEQEGTP